ncbi:MAG: MnhB domain-containing protein [Caldilineaceae bacterium]
MPELYLRLLDRIMTPVLLVFAIVLLLRGHNEPGGGFIAGLVVAAAFELQILSRGEAVVRRTIGAYLQPLTGIGLSMAALSATLGILYGSFFKGIWWELHWGAVKLDLSTPLFFDIGVFMVVFSIVTSYLLGLSQREE